MLPSWLDSDSFADARSGWVAWDHRIGAGGRYIGRRVEVGGIWKKVCEGGKGKRQSDLSWWLGSALVFGPRKHNGAPLSVEFIFCCMLSSVVFLWALYAPVDVNRI